MAAVLQIEQPQELIAAGGGLAGAQAVNGGGERDMLLDGEIVEQAEALGQNAADLLQRERVFGRIEPGNRDRAGCGRQQAGKHLHDSRLAGAVRSEQGADSAAWDLEGDARHRPEFAEVAHQVLAFDQWWSTLFAISLARNSPMSVTSRSTTAPAKRSPFAAEALVGSPTVPVFEYRLNHSWKNTGEAFSRSQ